MSSMNYNALPLNPISPWQLSGNYGAFGSNISNMQDPCISMSTLQCLRGQKAYLEHLLCKTVTTLNALRDRQTKNARALDANPTPRSKKKKIMQNKWRTNKTIKTCENEERVILDCLQVCSNNISTLEAIVSPTDLSSTAAEYNSNNSYAGSETTSFDWHGWAADAVVPPWEKKGMTLVSMDEISPEACPGASGRPELDSRTPRAAKRPPPLPPRSFTAPPMMMPLAPPNSAHTVFSYSALSPQAAVFEPSVTHNPTMDSDMPKQLDKLCISGLLASKRMRMIQKRRFSDAAIGHLFGRLSPHARPQFAQPHWHQSWAAPSPEEDGEEGESHVSIPMKRVNSI